MSPNDTEHDDPEVVVYESNKFVVANTSWLSCDKWVSERNPFETGTTPTLGWVIILLHDRRHLN
ncbi:hypothetical protein H5410_036017 [Solanum commersonii]|uniref:Uncharacterized protein n=1 Tax=Solanum commersonii TaxID=4109 RepID=A0A9J5Y2Y1_SOLCO|nr:hypothetical protein H5410_036017 [Solanum commersonii]